MLSRRGSFGLFLIAVFLFLSTLGISINSYAATITVVNGDGPGEGFNDPTPFTPVGGNGATTLGQARLNAFRAAADLWGSVLESSVVIVVRANFNPMGGSSTSAILGSAGAYTMHNLFPNQPVSNTYYPAALANALAGTDLNGSNPEITATFNSDVDNPTVLGSIDWYYGLDGNTGGDIDFFTVVLHELGHGLGFMDLIGNDGSLSIPGIFDRNLVYDTNGTVSGLVDLISMSTQERLAAITSGSRLLWNGANVTAGAIGTLIGGLGIGGRVQMFAPDPVQPGSSVAHFNTAVAPNEVMEPSYTGPNHDIDLTLALFEDLGWTSGLSVSTGCDCNAPGAILGDENDNVIDGTSGDDIICGLGGNDTIRGLGGSDCIDGGEGSDVIRGNGGNDTLIGGIGNDRLVGGIGNDTLKGQDGIDILLGNSGNDTLMGGDGDDILRGHENNDTLDGGPGTDTLNGGPDFDTCTNGENKLGCEN